MVDFLTAHTGDAATSSLVRPSWATLQEKPESAFAEVVDNFVTNNSNVHIRTVDVNGNFTIMLEGPSRVHDPSQLFNLGQPTINHGGALNQKGHGLKIFQAKFGCDVIVFIRRETDDSKRARQTLPLDPVYNYFLVRYGPRHDHSFNINSEGPTTIKITWAPVMLTTQNILGTAPFDVATGLFTQNVFCKTDLINRNKSDVLSHFDTFPKTGDYVSFVYWGFNENNSSSIIGLNLGVPRREFQDSLGNTEILVGGQPLSTDLANKYLMRYPNVARIPKILINGTDLQNSLHISDAFEMSGMNDYSFTHEGQEMEYSMAAGWPKDFDFQEYNKRSKTLENWPNIGTLLYYHGRACYNNPNKWKALYDLWCMESINASYSDVTTQLSRGGKHKDRVKNTYAMFESHLGQCLPFTKQEFERIYTICKSMHQPGKNGWYLLFGMPILFIVNSIHFKMTTSKESLMPELTNGIPSKILLQHIRLSQLKWAFENMDKILQADKTVKTEIESEEEEVQVVDDTEEQVDDAEEQDVDHDDDNNKVNEIEVQIEQEESDHDDDQPELPRVSYSSRKIVKPTRLISEPATKKIKKPRQTITEFKKKVKHILKKYKGQSGDPIFYDFVNELQSVVK